MNKIIKNKMGKYLGTSHNEDEWFPDHLEEGSIVFLIDVKEPVKYYTVIIDKSWGDSMVVGALIQTADINGVISDDWDFMYDEYEPERIEGDFVIDNWDFDESDPSYKIFDGNQSDIADIFKVMNEI